MYTLVGLVPDAVNPDGTYNPPRPSDILTALRYRVLLGVEPPSCDGYSPVLLWNGSKFGHVVLPWGGCDWCCTAVNQLPNLEAVGAYLSELEDDIVWHRRGAMIEFLHGLPWFTDNGRWAELDRRFRTLAPLVVAGLVEPLEWLEDEDEG